MYCNRKIIVCRLLDADGRQYVDKFKLLGIDKSPYEIPRTEWMNDSGGIQDGIDSMTVDSY